MNANNYTQEEINNLEVIDPIIVDSNPNPEKMNKTEVPVVKAIEDMSLEEIEAFTAKKRKAKATKEARVKQQYEDERNHVVVNLFDLAKKCSEFLEDLKRTTVIEMTKQATALSDYGKMPMKSKGGFSITSADGKIRITRLRATEPHWDERSLKAVELITAFLGDTIKKKDKRLYVILLSFLEKGKDGKMEYARVMNLYQHEDAYDDPRWKEGLRLIKESHTNHLKAFAFKFKTRTDGGIWEDLPLNFYNI